MRCYKQVEGNKLISIGKGVGGIEISEEEYNKLSDAIHEKIKWADNVYHNPENISKVPVEWREEIRQRAEERKQIEIEAQNSEISESELGRMIMEGLQ